MAIPIAMMVAGTLAKMQSDSQQQKAREDVMAAENARQQGYQQEAAAVQDKAVAGFDRAKQDATQEQQFVRRSDANVGALKSESPENIPISDSQPAVVKSTIARALNDAMTRGTDEAKAKARLGSFGDLQFVNGVDLNRSGQQQGQFGSFARGSSGVVPMEMQHANSAGGGMRTFGNLLQMGGQGLGMGMSMGWNPLASLGGGAMADRGGSAYPGSKW